MYTAAFSAAALSLRATSSFHYNPLTVNHRRSGKCCGCCCHCCCVPSCNSFSSASLHEISINPRFVIGGYLLRQSALFRWAPSRCSFRSSDGGLFEEMIGLLADGFTGCDEGCFCSRSNGVDILGRRRVRYEVEVEDVDEKQVPGLGKHCGFGNSAWSSDAREKDEKGDLRSRKHGVLERKVVKIHGTGDDGAKESWRSQSHSSVIHGRGQHDDERKRYTSAAERQLGRRDRRDRTSVDFTENTVIRNVVGHGSSSNSNRMFDDKSNSVKNSTQMARDNKSLMHQLGDKQQPKDRIQEQYDLEDKRLNKSLGTSDSGQKLFQFGRDERTNDQETVSAMNQHSRSNAYIANLQETDTRTLGSSRRLSTANTVHGQENSGLVRRVNIDRQQEGHTRVSQLQTNLDKREDKSENTSTSVNFVLKRRDSSTQRKQTVNFVGVNEQQGSSTNDYDIHVTDFEKTRSSHSLVEAKVDDREHRETSVQKMDLHGHHENLTKGSYISHSNDILDDARVKRREEVSTSVETQVQVGSNTRSHDQHASIHDSDAKRVSIGLQRFAGAKLDDREEYKDSFFRTDDVNVQHEDRTNMSVGSQDSRANIRENISNSVQNIIQDEKDTRAQDQLDINTVWEFENHGGRGTGDQQSWSKEKISGSNNSRKETSRDNKVHEFSRSNALQVSGVLVEASSETEKNKESSQRKMMFVGESSLSMGTHTTSGSSGDLTINAHIQESGNQSSSSSSGVLLESVRRFDESSAYFVGEFIDKVHQEISAMGSLDEASKNSTKVGREESDRGTAQPSSRSGQKGPSDEMWDVKDFSSQEVSKTDDRENSSSSVGVVDTNTSPGTDTSMARRAHRSLWAYIADIIQLGWFSHGRRSHKSEKTRTRSSSNESFGSETWFSGHEQYESDATKVKHNIPTETVTTEAPSIADQSSLLGNTSLETGMVSETTNRPEFSFWGTDVEDRPSESTGDIAPSSLKEKITNIEIHQIPEVKSLKLEGEHNREKEPAVEEIVGQDGNLKQRKLQRNKQVLRQSFDEWELACMLESEQRKVDEFFMREALVEAKKAADYWEVPVGAVLVHDGKIIARGYNLVEELRDSTAHAEMICIREASNHLRTWRLAETTLYVTLEPCPMCAGAILQARIDTVVWGAPNKLLGADGSWIRLFPGDDGSPSDLDPSNRSTGPIHPFHPKIVVRRGILERECSDAMQHFFRRRRKKDKKEEPPHCLPIATANPAKILTKMHNLLCAMFCL